MRSQSLCKWNESVKMCVVSQIALSWFLVGEESDSNEVG